MVHVLTNSMGGRERNANKNGVEVHGVEFPPPPKPHVETAAVCQFNSLLLERTPEVFSVHGPFDIVNSHDWLTALAGHHCSKLYGPLHIWTVRGTCLSVTVHSVVSQRNPVPLDSHGRRESQAPVGYVSRSSCPPAAVRPTRREKTRFASLHSVSASGYSRAARAQCSQDASAASTGACLM